jgi:hypothetical protein
MSQKRRLGIAVVGLACAVGVGFPAIAMSACGSGNSGGSPGGALADGAATDGRIEDAPRTEHNTGPSDAGLVSDAGQELVAEHALAQVGFAIAMASSVLQTQLLVIGTLGNVPDAATCTPLPGGGSGEPGPAATMQHYGVFYDSSCTQPYIEVVADVPSLDAGTISTFQFKETLQYHGLDGGRLGELALTQVLSDPNLPDGGQGNLHAYGTGTFTPASGGTPVQLGLTCELADPIVCAGGVAQDFPSLSLALGSVTPLTLTTPDGGMPELFPSADGGSPIDFSGTASSVVAGSLGSLVLGTPAPPALAIDGGHRYTSMTTSGSAGAFSFFPPTPTGWTITDSTHDERFQIDVVSNTVRNLAATITRVSTGAKLANATLDQSGTGRITYSDGSTATVTSWTLAD